MQLDIGELTGAVNRHKQIELAFLCAHFSDIDIKIANRIFLNFFFASLLPSTFGNQLIP